MSFRINKYLNFDQHSRNPGEDFLQGKSQGELQSLFLEILKNGVHGFCFSLYEEGQKPGDIISEEQIRRRMEILKPHTSWIRSFSCTEGNELIPKIAKEYGIKTLVGAWLGDDEEKNEEEIKALIKLAEEGYVDIAAVGNEVLYRKDLNEEQLLEKIAYVKEKLPNTKVGYVDAYYEFVVRPKIAEICDVILCNCYPYWEGTHFEYSLEHVQQMYQQCKNVAGGKDVIITETGWPSQGESLGNAIPSTDKAMNYFINIQL